MLRVARSHYDRTLIIQQLRDRFLRRARGGKSTIEDVSLPLDFSGNRFYANGDADHALRKSDPLEMRANESHPRLMAGRRSSRTHQVLVALAIGEREDHRHLTRALAARLEIRRDVSDERVDYENEALRILERVLHPVERSRWQRPRHAGEDAARVISPRQSPETRSLGAETNFDRLEIEPRQISAPIPSSSVDRESDDSSTPMGYGARYSRSDPGAIAMRPPFP